MLWSDSLMLAALVLTLKPTATATVAAFLGRAAHAWFLSQVCQADPQLAQKLHTPHTPRPFTVSPLWPPSSRVHGDSLRLSAGQACHLRITSIETDLSYHLLNTFAQRWANATVHLAGVPFHVDGVANTADRHPQAAHLPYDALIESTEHSPLSDSVTLRFLTPTTFRRSPPPDGPFGDRSYDLPFPLPSLVFGGLFRLWNAFGPQPLPEELRAFARDCVVVSRYRLRTERVDFGSGRRGRVGGFVGVCRFAIRCPEAVWRRRIGLLAAFAPFAGVGWRTTMGLGQTQLEE
jgi:CRISPR-associated endoribonuclease Cas6